jgi:nicotinate-nucleotide pyrophosphorylase (carboxylating)
MNFSSTEINDFIKRSLQEDIGSGDHTSLASIPAGKQGKARLIFKENGIVAGLDLALQIMKTVDENLQVEFFKKDGDFVNYGDIGFHVTGSVHAILASERLLLNCMQRLSGIATQTHHIVEKVKGTNAKILDTRKTTPGLRLLEKWAVKIGGGYNHRFGLYDMILLKDNHVDYAGGISVAVNNSVSYLKKHNLNLDIEVETRNLDEVKEAIALPEVKRIMFDNFTPAVMSQAVLLVNKQKETEASGGITLENIREYAETGVDYISVGALTHSVKSLDISLKEF